MKKIISTILLAASAFVSVAHAQIPGIDPRPAVIKTLISVAIAPMVKQQGAVLNDILPTKYPGLYEVDTSMGIFYTNETGDYLFFNAQLVDAKTMRNETSARVEQLAKFDFKDLPLADAIKTVRGNGKRQIATFEDPNCGYCHKEMLELDKLTDVTVYTFMIPILAEDSRSKASQIWCASNPATAWAKLMRDGVPPPVANVSSCQTPLDRNLSFAQQHQIRATPALLFADGSMTRHYLSADDIDQHLKQQ